MNIKRLWKPLSLLSLFVAVVAQADETILYDRVNTSMEIVANAVVFGDNQVEYARPKFDEKICDLKAGRIKYDLTGLIKNSPWHSGSKTVIKGTTTVTTDRTANHTGVGVTSNINMKTDFLALFRYGNMIAWKNLAGVPQKFESRVKDAIIRGAQTKTLRDMYKLLLEGKQLGSEMSQEKIEKEQAWLACLTAGTCGGGSPTEVSEQIVQTEKRIRRFQSQKSSYENTEIIALPSSEDVWQVRVENKSPAGFTKEDRLGLTPTLVVSSIEAGQVDTRIDGFEPKTTSQLDKLHERLEALLINIQVGDLKTKDEMFEGFSQGLFRFKEVINGDWPKK